MSRSIIFNGHDFGEISTCDVTPAGFCGVTPEVVEVAGRPGKAIVEGNLLPLTIGVRLYLDAGCVLGFGGVSAVRRAIASWLAATDGASLVLPEEPGLEWHDVICSGGTAWSSPGPDAWCDLTFVAYDPVAYGETKSFNDVASVDLTVGGTWETRPQVTLVVTEACEGLTLSVGTDAFTLTGSFAQGDVVLVDCEGEHVAVNGLAANERVADGSSYLRLAPGDTTVTCPHANILITITERWV